MEGSQWLRDVKVIEGQFVREAHGVGRAIARRSLGLRCLYDLCTSTTSTRI